MVLEDRAMAGGDPTALLDAMGVLLGEFGQIKTPHEVGTVIGLMKEAEKLLNRCIFLNILRATIELAPENSVSLETIRQFVKDGGCAILNKWLADAKDLENLPIILDVLELLEAMPVTVEALKQGNIGKLVKQLTKSEEKAIKELASGILDKWMVLVKGKPKKNKSKTEGTPDDANNSGSPTAKRSRENSTENQPKQPPEKKMKSLSEAKSSVTSVAKPAPKVKVMQALPKPVVMESSGFMNALIQHAVPKIPKKKKKVAPPPSPKEKQSYSGPLEEILQNQSQTHGEEKEKSGKEQEKEKEKEEKDEDKDKNEEDEKDDEKETEKEEKADSSIQENKDMAGENSNQVTVKESPDASPVATKPAAEASVSGNVDEARLPEEVEKTGDQGETELKKDVPENVSKKKKKRSIKWADDENLLQYHYYEPDEEEPKVQHVVNFHDAQHQEAMRERQRVEQAKRLSEDKMMEKQNWYRPKPMGVAELMNRGENSEERHQQKERESKILPDLFFSKSSLPVSPREPDAEPNTGPTSQPLVIPHDEKGSVYPPSKGPVNVFSLPSSEAPPAGGNLTPSLPPALATLLANASKGQGSQGIPAVLGANPALANVDVQELLNKLMSSTQNADDQGIAEESALQLQNELGGPRFANMGPQFRGPGRPPGEQGPRGMPQDQLRHGPPDFRPRGPLLRTPGPDMRFPVMQQRGGGPPTRGRFHGRPQMRHPIPGHRMQGMGRAGMINRFQVPEGNRESGDQFPFQEGENAEGHNMGPRVRGMRGRGGGRARPMCRHFMSPRGCMRGNICPFLHPGVNAPPV